MVVNHKKVYRIMKSENILCQIRRSFKKTTNSSHNFVKYPNLIKGIMPLGVNQIWHADITYIRLRASFAYLAALIDGYSRKVVGDMPWEGHSQQSLPQRHCWMLYQTGISVAVLLTILIREFNTAL